MSCANAPTPDLAAVLLGSAAKLCASTLTGPPLVRPEAIPVIWAAGGITRQSPPPAVHQPARKYVTFWKHLKQQCQGNSYSKVAEQCGGRGMWHGIFCRVTWIDGSTEDLHGKVDLTDPYGREYCTRSTRPARFNCVSRCDDSNGPLTTLPSPN
jgi:hypothetical protein